MSLHATIKTPLSPAILTLEMDGDWEARVPIKITSSDDHSGLARERLRYWLNHIATGLFGHMVSSDKIAAPVDVYHALVTSKEWDIKIERADAREVRLDLPDGAVS